MNTQEKLAVIGAVIDAVALEQNEKVEFLQSVVQKFEVPLWDVYPAYKQQVNKFFQETDGLSDIAESAAQPQITDVPVPISEDVPRSRSVKTGKPVKLNKNGQPRKPYTRRKKDENTAAAASKEDVAAAEKTVAPLVENSLSAERDYRVLTSNQDDLGWKVLYQNPNNAKGLFISTKVCPNCKAVGVAVPYPNGSSCFAVALFAETKLLSSKEAAALAKKLPKFHGMNWEVMTGKHQAALDAVRTSLNRILDRFHGTPVGEKYLTLPYDAAQSSRKARFVIELPGIVFNGE